MTTRSAVPSLVPTLSAGRHRSARRGACFMEFASYLAGERWSDHPACTDPTLALLARAVNDTVGDARRGELAAEVPRVVGLRGDDSVIGLVVALRAAAEALPVASRERQNALAAGLRIARDALERTAPALVDEALLAEAADSAPGAVRWAREHVAPLDTASARRLSRARTAMVATAVAGIGLACVDDAEDRLVGLLRRAIADVERITRLAASDAASPAAPVPEFAAPLLAC